MKIGAGGELDMEIVGMVKDAKYSEVKQVVPPQFFVPYRQTNQVGSLVFYISSSVEPDSLLTSIPNVVRRLDPNLPVDNLRTLPQQIRENVFGDRTIGILATSFAVLATLLAAFGLYGVLGYTVAQRTREFGVRMALGATSSDVRRMIFRQVTMMTLIGGVLGLAAAIALGRLAQSLLFEIESHDPVVLAAAAVLQSLVAIGAGFIPARRASRVDPMQALRYE
jgi:ABC-type antimicrobial peptide transport system permease subunit